MRRVLWIQPSPNPKRVPCFCYRVQHIAVMELHLHFSFHSLSFISQPYHFKYFPEFKNELFKKHIFNKSNHKISIKTLKTLHQQETEKRKKAHEQLKVRLKFSFVSIRLMFRKRGQEKRRLEKKNGMKNSFKAIGFY